MYMYYVLQPALHLCVHVADGTPNVQYVCNSYNMATRVLADLSPEGDKLAERPKSSRFDGCGHMYGSARGRQILQYKINPNPNPNTNPSSPY